MYDPFRAYQEGYVQPRARMLAQIGAYRAIGHPGAETSAQILTARIADLDKRQRQEVVQHALHQMRFWRPLSGQMRLVFRLYPKGGA